MAKRISISLIVIALLILSGCTQGPAQAPQGLSDADVATLVAVATQAAVAPPESIQPTATVQAEGSSAPTRTPMPGSITITGIQETGTGKAIVSWEATGEFPAGFKVVWTNVQGLPTFPEDTSVFVGDPAARAAMISGKTGEIYYVRVCRFTGDGCDIYSNLGIFAYVMNALTPQPTITPRPADATATKQAAILTPKPTTSGWIPGTPGVWIDIVEMKGGEDGKAYMKWDSGYSPTAGFKILYSTTNKTPTYGTDPYYYVGGTVRQAWVDGIQGKTYYYRICGFNGTKCEVYSPVYTYKFPGTAPVPTTAPTATPDGSTLSILLISDDEPGAVQVDWTASGSFPNGYKVVYSQTNPLPTTADGYVYVSDPNQFSTIVSGLQPGKQYYFRVCKYYGGACTIYSAVSTFTVAAAAEEAGFTLTEVSNVVGSVEIAWSIGSDSANGYKVLMSATDPVPPDAYLALVSDPATHSYVDSATAEGAVYYRVCRWSGAWCLSYSNTLPVTIVAATP